MTPQPAQPLVSVNGLSFSYGERKVLNGLSFEIPSPQILCFLGPNGCGKTTLFRILSTLVSPEPDRVRIFGLDPARETTAIRRRLGVVFQNPALDPQLRVIENLRGAGHLFGMRGRQLEEAILRQAAEIGIEDRLHEPVEALSGGLRRRVEIAKALLPSPDLLVLDEPSTGLDPGAREACIGIFRRLRSSGKTILLTSHLLEEAAHADRVAVMHRGEIVTQGAPGALCAALGEGLLIVESPSPHALAARIPPDDSHIVRIVENTVRILGPDPYSLAARLASDAPDLVLSTSVSRPNLADVFAHHAGLTMAQAEMEDAK